MKLPVEILDPTLPPEHYRFKEETDLWIPPEDCPEGIVQKYMPDAAAAKNYVAWRIFFKEKPEWWNSGYGMQVVNMRRKAVYKLWRRGEYARLGYGVSGHPDSKEVIS